MSNDTLEGFIIIFIIVIMLTSMVLGYSLGRSEIEDDCELMNAFRVDERVYMCMQEYIFEE